MSSVWGSWQPCMQSHTVTIFIAVGLCLCSDRMKLAECLFRWKKALPGGHLWRGKYRLYREVTPHHMKMQRRKYELEEQNMFYLRHPYLTIEESHGHAKILGLHQKLVEESRAKKLNWREDLKLGDHLGILKVSDRWE